MKKTDYILSGTIQVSFVLGALLYLLNMSFGGKCILVKNTLLIVLLILIVSLTTGIIKWTRK